LAWISNFSCSSSTSMSISAQNVIGCTARLGYMCHPLMPTPVGHLVLLANAIRSISGWWYFGTQPTRPRRGRRIRPSSFETIRKDQSLRPECVSQFWASRQQGQKIGRALVWLSGDMHASPSRLLKSCDRQACPLCRETGGGLVKERRKKIKIKENQEKIKSPFSLPHRSIATRRGASPNFTRLARNRWLLGAVLAQSLWLPLSSRWPRHRRKDVDT
jgi:hypothetical protein